MTLKARIIPCLDVKDGRVVKGVNFVDLIDAGDPVEAARAYDAAGADELCEDRRRKAGVAMRISEEAEEPIVLDPNGRVIVAVDPVDACDVNENELEARS